MMAYPRSPKRRTAALLALALLCMAPAIGAQPVAAPNAPSAADKETARGLMNQGLQHLNEKRYNDALTALRGADGIMGVPTTRYAVGRALNALGRLVEAREVLLSVKRIPQPANESRPLEKAREQAAQLALDVSKKIPALTVVVTGSETYSLRIDDREIVAAAVALPQSLDPGSHAVVVQAPGYAEARHSVEVKEAETRTLKVLLEKLPEMPTPVPVVTPTPAPTVPQPQAPVDGDNGGGGVGPALAIAGFSVMGAGVLVGGISGGLALAESSTLDEMCIDNACPPQSQESYDKTLSLSHASTIGFAVAGVAAVVGTVGLVMLLSDDDGGADAATGSPVSRVQLRVGLGGLGVAGSF